MKIFLSYSRDDAEDVTGRLYERLSQHFGKEAVFKDVQSIRPGDNFQDTIATALDTSDVVLAIIGPRWLDAAAGGRRRGPDRPSDYVRRELEAALGQGKRVVPVLVGATQMPGAFDLPPSIRELAAKQAVRVRPDPDFETDIERLIRALETNTEALERAGRNRRHDAPSHQLAAMPLHVLIVCVFGILALASIAAGVYAVTITSTSATTLTIWGAQLTTDHVGVALMGMGFIIALFAVRSVLANQRDLASVPWDGSTRPMHAAGLPRRARPSRLGRVLITMTCTAATSVVGLAMLWSAYARQGRSIEQEILDARRPNITQPQYLHPATDAEAPSTPNSTLLLFVHGIFGDTIGTWSRAGRTDSLPSLILARKEFSAGFDTFAFGYSTAMFQRGSLQIPEAATTLATEIKFRSFLTKYKRIVIVAHSMGGLIALETLTVNPDIRAHVPLVVTFATPYDGAQVATLANHLLANPALADMVPRDGNNSFLSSLANRWKRSRNTGGAATRVVCAYEKVSLPSIGLIVPETSASSLCDDVADPITEDHIGIIKPDGAEHQSVKVLTNALRTMLEAASREPPVSADGPGVHRDATGKVAVVRPDGVSEPTIDPKHSASPMGSPGPCDADTAAVSIGDFDADLRKLADCAGRHQLSLVGAPARMTTDHNRYLSKTPMLAGTSSCRIERQNGGLYKVMCTVDKTARHLGSSVKDLGPYVESAIPGLRLHGDGDNKKYEEKLSGSVTGAIKFQVNLYRTHNAPDDRVIEILETP